MTCEIDDSLAESLWPPLLALRCSLKDPGSLSAPRVFFVRTGGRWEYVEQEAKLPPDPDGVLIIPLADDAPLDPPPTLAPETEFALFRFDRFLAGDDPFVPGRGKLDGHTRTFFRLYLPMILGGYRARLEGGIYLTAHLAQTLDGRIACRNGHSHWISNEADLFHAHRLRALHDAVAVGGRTVEADDPQLTVRHVEGEDPVRLVLCGSAAVLRRGKPYHVFDEAGSILLCHPASAARLAPEDRIDSVELLTIDVSEEGPIPPDAIRDALVAHGIHSVFLEGGGLTLSNFIQHQAVDLLHVHMAPVVLGSGIRGFSLPEVASVQEGQRFTMQHFFLNGEVLLECRVPHGAKQ